jgi:hypothetical protein
MKKSYLLFLVLIYCIACKTSKTVSSSFASKVQELPPSSIEQKSSVVNDTLNYAKEIIANKSKYINKELGVLLNDLKIPVKSYSIRNSRYDVIDGINLSFDDRSNTNRKQAQDDDSKKPGYLHITWKTPIQVAKHKEIMEKSTSKGDWQAAEQEFYPKQIIGNID